MLYLGVIWNKTDSINLSIKFVFVFLGTTLLSWATVQAALRIPKVRDVV